MNIAVISCGRSDYSIYLPILKNLRADAFFDLHIIAFGTHVSEFYDRTVDLFYKDEFTVDYEVESLVLGDSSEAIASAIGLTTIKFSSIWQQENYDLILVLGDRYEMFAAISASVPFNIPVAHLHGGETTLGAIDDKFRHCITSMSKLHFTSTEGHAKRVKSILGHSKYVYNVGAPALDNIRDLKLMNNEEFFHEWGINLKLPTVLVTYHPETVALESNQRNIRELFLAMEAIDMQFVITMPNNDTLGADIRKKIIAFVAKNENKYKIVEVLGVVGYYSCMAHSKFLLGNTSSGIIEAASFKKYVINLGDRQKGRECGPNVLHIPLESKRILEAVKRISNYPEYDGGNIYGQGYASEKILKLIKEYVQDK